MEIGDLALVGTPCDFSGELVEGIQKSCAKNREVMITSFNGQYIGYITADKHYEKDTHDLGGHANGFSRLGTIHPTLSYA